MSLNLYYCLLTFGLRQSGVRVCGLGWGLSSKESSLVWLASSYGEGQFKAQNILGVGIVNPPCKKKTNLAIV